MLRPKKRIAAVLGAVTMAGSAGLVALAPSAMAESVTIPVSCEPPVPPSPVTGDQAIELVLPNSPVAPGSTVDVTVKMGPSPAKSPATMNDVGFDFTMDFAGGAKLTDGKGKLNIVKDQPVTLPEFTAKITVPADANADVDLVPTGWKVVTLGFPTTCAPTSNPTPSLGTIDVDVAAPKIQLDKTEGEVGTEVTVTGSNFPDGPVTITGQKDGGATADTANATAESGAFTAKLKVNDPATTKIVATSGDKKAEAAFTVKQAAAPKLTLSPAEGPVGTKVSVKGEHFPAGAVEVVGLKGDTATEDKASGTAAADGTFTVELEVKDKDTTKIKATAGDKSAEAAFTVKEDEPTGPDPIDPKEVNVTYLCKTEVVGMNVPIPETTPTYPIKITLPKTAKAQDEVDVEVSLKDNIIGAAPDLVPPNTELQVSAAMTVDVAQGSDKSDFQVIDPKRPVTLSPGDNLTVSGPLKGKFKVWGGGMFDFRPGKIIVSTEVKLSPESPVITSNTTCTVTSTAVSAQLKATGAQGTPPPPSTTGGTTTSGNNGGLANTGTDGGSVSAFALAAGTLVLGATAVMLLLPYRRRRMQARG